MSTTLDVLPAAANSTSQPTAWLRDVRWPLGRVARVDDLATASELLDQLEALGCTDQELVVLPNRAGFLVRWA